MIDESLLAILVCPTDHGPLLLVQRSGESGDRVLYNPRLRRAYRIEDGIPVLLVDEAVPVDDDDEHAHLIAQVPPADPR